MTVVVIPKFEFIKFMDSIVKYKITHLPLVPPQIVLVCPFLFRLAESVSYLTLPYSSVKCAIATIRAVT